MVMLPNEKCTHYSPILIMYMNGEWWRVIVICVYCAIMYIIDELSDSLVNKI